MRIKSDANLPLRRYNVFTYLVRVSSLFKASVELADGLDPKSSGEIKTISDIKFILLEPDSIAILQREQMAGMEIFFLVDPRWKYQELSEALLMVYGFCKPTVWRYSTTSKFETFLKSNARSLDDLVLEIDREKLADYLELEQWLCYYKFMALILLLFTILSVVLISQAPNCSDLPISTNAVCIDST